MSIRRQELKNIRIKEHKNSYVPGSNVLSSSGAFSILEMLVTIAVMAAVFLVATSPDLGSSSAKKQFQNTYKEINDTLSNARNEAMARGTTTRVVIDEEDGAYAIASYFAAAPTNNCNSASVGTEISTKTMEVHGKYEITGSGMAGVCFFRDGSSSAGAFIVSPIEAEEGLKTATITMIMATGFVDVAVDE